MPIYDHEKKLKAAEKTIRSADLQVKNFKENQGFSFLWEEMGKKGLAYDYYETSRFLG